MRLSPSLRAIPALGAVVAASAVLACSSDSATGPTTVRNAQLILRFDSLHNETLDPNRSSAMLDIAQILAEGAPIATGTITVNGTPERWNMIAELEVLDLAGAPADSQYTVAAWKGDGADSIVLFGESGGIVAVLVSTPLGSAEFIGSGTPTVTLGALGAACQSFLSVTPVDVSAPVPVQCQRQTASIAFDTVSVAQGTYALPAQSVSGIRVETNVPTPVP